MTATPPAAATIATTLDRAVLPITRRMAEQATGLTFNGSIAVCGRPRIRPHHRAYSTSCEQSVWLSGGTGGLCTFSFRLGLQRGYLPTLIVNDLRGTLHLRHRWGARIKSTGVGCIA